MTGIWSSMTKRQGSYQHRVTPFSQLETEYVTFDTRSRSVCSSSLSQMTVSHAKVFLHTLKRTCSCSLPHKNHQLMISLYVVLSCALSECGLATPASYAHSSVPEANLFHDARHTLLRGLGKKGRGASEGHATSQYGCHKPQHDSTGLPPHRLMRSPSSHPPFPTCKERS